MDDEFFSKYKKVFDNSAGIPGFKMNAPLTHNTFTGKIGLELELEPEGRNRLPTDGHLEAFETPRSKARWLSVEDGSLRGGGREYIVSAPILVDEVDETLDALWEVFEKGNVRLSNTNRCSTHVHVNMSGKMVNQVTSILVLWGTFEELLINWCGEERKTNHFCLGMKDSETVVSAWNRLLTTGSHGGLSRDLKYSALNVLPIWDRGSIEFRCGPAADTKEIPKLWAKFLYGFTEYASSKFPNPEQIAHALSEQGGYRMFIDICGENVDFCEQVLRDFSVQQVDELAMRGFRKVQRLALGVPWSDWLPLINREYVPNPFAKPEKKSTRRPGLQGLEFIGMNPTQAIDRDGFQRVVRDAERMFDAQRAVRTVEDNF